VGGWWWRLFGAPIDGGAARRFFAGAIWDLIRGAAPLKRPDAAALGRRYAEVLAENLGQPGFRELMVVVTDVDTRSDILAAMLREPYRREFTARRAGRERQAEIIDLAGLGRDHALDIVAAAVTPSLGTDPCLVAFGRDSYWRGETHRLCDRPGSVARLLDELAGAGVNVDTILLTGPEIVFTAPTEDGRDVEAVLERLKVRWSARDDLGKVSVVGAGMKSHPGVAAKTFATLSELGIEPEIVSTSPIKIACHVSSSRVEEAVAALHVAFELDRPEAERAHA
jgi:hypothetical protein